MSKLGYEIIWRVEDGKDNCMEVFEDWHDAVHYAKQNDYPEVFKYKVLDDGNEEVIACIWNRGVFVG